MKQLCPQCGQAYALPVHSCSEWRGDPVDRLAVAFWSIMAALTVVGVVCVSAISQAS